MGRSAIVAGTGFENPDGSNRCNIIRRFVRDGMEVTLIREQNNMHDPNAVAVYISAPRLFGLLGTSQKQIGYLKASAAKSIAKRMDDGEKITGHVANYYAPAGIDHPRVSLLLEY